MHTRHLPPALECEYLWVSSRIPKRNFHGSAQSNGVEQYSEQSRRPTSQQGILKKAERYAITASWGTGSPIIVLLQATIYQLSTYHNQQYICCVDAIVLHTVARKFSDRKYFIDKKFKVKHFCGCIDFLEIFLLWT